MITPLRTLLFLLLVALLAGLLMLVTPEQGWQLAGLKIKYPTWSGFWESQRRGQGVAMDEFFDIYARKAEVNTDSLAEVERAFRLKMRYFQYPGDEPAVMAAFFEQLERQSREGRVRILHFGDSQIESHRITGYLNRRFQQRYGGSGPGWVPVVEVIPTPEVRQESSEGWLRFTAFGPPRSETHKRYGLPGSFARFQPQWPEDEADPTPEGDTLQQATATPVPSIRPEGLVGGTKAWFAISPPRRGGGGLYPGTTRVRIFPGYRACRGAGGRHPFRPAGLAPAGSGGHQGMGLFRGHAR